jgi:rod shape-determining protein MreC
MERIFLFIYHYRAFFTFLLLELFCAWLIIQNNQYQGARFFNSSNSFVAAVNGLSQNVHDYFSLRDVNQVLADENAKLHSELELQKQFIQSLGVTPDSVIIKRFDFVSAKVVNNSVDFATNFITINKGSADSIQSGMAVLGPQGIVGKVKITSEHFSVVTSILNIDIMVSGLLKRTGYYGTIQWDGNDPDLIDLKFIPRHVKPLKGDTIVTSGYSGIFPEGIMVGTIERVNLPEGAPFYELKVKLTQDFRKLSFVSVIKSNLYNEIDSLEQQIPKMKQ